MQKSEEVKEKLKSAAQDLRQIADSGHPYAGNLHEKAEVVEKLVDGCEEILEHAIPNGKSGEGLDLPEEEKKMQIAKCRQKQEH